LTDTHTGLLEGLREYVQLLERAAATTTRAEDRSKYRDHLAEAARMLAAVTGTNPDWTKVREILLGEERAFGWSYLSDSIGAEVEAAFSRLRSLAQGK
jgi:hypothetical protein